MKTQPYAVGLADGLARALQRVDADDDVIDVARWFVEDTEVELRRLHAVNEELLVALKQHVQLHDGDCICQNCAAIAKAGGAA